jgi:hypothetical protein
MTTHNGAEQPLDHQSWPQQYDGIHKRSQFSRRRVAQHEFLEGKSDNYLGMQGYTTLQEILDKLSEIAPGVPASEILLNFWQLRWTTDATPEEIAEREAKKAAAAANSEKWERETLARLTEKYGPPDVH